MPLDQFQRAGIECIFCHEVHDLDPVLLSRPIHPADCLLPVGRVQRPTDKRHNPASLLEIHALAESSIRQQHVCQPRLEPRDLCTRIACVSADHCGPVFRKAFSQQVQGSGPCGIYDDRLPEGIDPLLDGIELGGVGNTHDTARIISDKSIRDLAALRNKPLTPEEINALAELGLYLLPAASATSWLAGFTLNLWLAGRITHVADVYDAMTHPQGTSALERRDEAIAHIHDEAGFAFDPEVVAAFDAVMRRSDIE